MLSSEWSVIIIWPLLCNLVVQCMQVQDASSGWRRFHQGIEGMQEKAKDLSNEKVLSSNFVGQDAMCIRISHVHPLPCSYASRRTSFRLWLHLYFWGASFFPGKRSLCQCKDIEFLRKHLHMSIKRKMVGSPESWLFRGWHKIILLPPFPYAPRETEHCKQWQMEAPESQTGDVPIVLASLLESNVHVAHVAPLTLTAAGLRRESFPAGCRNEICTHHPFWKK